MKPWTPSDSVCPWCGTHADDPHVVRTPEIGAAEIRCRQCSRSHYQNQNKPGEIALLYRGDLAPGFREQLNDSPEKVVFQRPQVQE